MTAPDPASIAVTGTVELHHPAERGTLRLAVSWEAADREVAVGRVTALHADVVREAKGFVAGGAATWWSSEGIAVWSAEKWTSDDTSEQEKKKRVRYHVAAVTVSVKFRDFAALGDWAVRRGSVDGCSVSGVRWALTDATRTALVLRARTGAVHDARSRAEAYASAAGLSGLELVALFEQGLRPHVTPDFSGAATMGRSGAAGGAGPTVELRPEDITVSASVTADYRAVRGE